MKYLKIILLVLAFSATSIAISSCGGNSKNTDNTKQQGKEYTSAYVCPMHCEGSGSEEAGICPVCGMDYVLNEDSNERE